MKAYLFEHEIIGAGGSRYELYAPGFGILWPGFSKIITNSEDMTKMQERVEKINEQIQKGFSKDYARKVLSYELIGERDISKKLIEEYVKWIKSEEISINGRKECGKKIEDLFGIKPAKGITAEQMIENMRLFYKKD